MASLFGRVGSAIGGFFTKPAKVSPTKTVGTGGTAIYGGYVQSKERNPALRGSKQWETYSDSAVNNATVGSVLRRTFELIAGAKWKFVPPKDGGSKAEDVAEKCELLLFKRMKATPWHRVTRKTATFRALGFSIQEPTAVKYDDGLIGWKEIAARPQHTIDRWDVDDETGQVNGVAQRSPQDFSERYLPREKMVYIHDDSLTDSPAGIGLMRHVAETVRTLDVLEKLEGRGFQGDIAGIPIGRAPLGYLNKQIAEGLMTAADRDRAVGGIRTIVENHNVDPKLGLLLDSATYPDKEGFPTSIPMFGFELAPATGKNLSALDVAINRKCREIARAFSAEFMLMGGDGAGSLAQHRDKTAAYAQSLNALLTELAWTYDLDVVAPMCRLNGWDESLWPELVPDPIQFQDVVAVVAAIEGMARAGAPLDPEDEVIDDIRESFGQRRRSPEIMQRMAEDALAPPAQFPFGAPFRPKPDKEPPPSGEAPTDGDVDIDVDDMAGEGDTGQDGDKAEKIAKASGDGVMVALYLPKGAAKAISLTGGADRDSLHVTLAYLGKGLDAQAIKDTVSAVRRSVGTFMQQTDGTGKLDGLIAGLGRFSASATSDGMDVIYASVDSVAIGPFRDALVRNLKAAALPVSEIHGFAPHITLTYVPSDAPTPITRIEPTPVTFGSVVVSAGIERIEVPIAQEP